MTSQEEWARLSVRSWFSKCSTVKRKQEEWLMASNDSGIVARKEQVEPKTSKCARRARMCLQICGDRWQWYKNQREASLLSQIWDSLNIKKDNGSNFPMERSGTHRCNQMIQLNITNSETPQGYVYLTCTWCMGGGEHLASPTHFLLLKMFHVQCEYNYEYVIRQGHIVAHFSKQLTLTLKKCECNERQKKEICSRTKEIKEK